MLLLGFSFPPFHCFFHSSYVCAYLWQSRLVGRPVSLSVPVLWSLILSRCLIRRRLELHEKLRPFTYRRCFLLLGGEEEPKESVGVGCKAALVCLSA